MGHDHAGVGRRCACDDQHGYAIGVHGPGCHPAVDGEQHHTDDGQGERGQTQRDGTGPGDGARVTAYHGKQCDSDPRAGEPAARS